MMFNISHTLFCASNGTIEIFGTSRVLQLSCHPSPPMFRLKNDVILALIHLLHIDAHFELFVETVKLIRIYQKST